MARELRRITDKYEALELWQAGMLVGTYGIPWGKFSYYKHGRLEREDPWWDRWRDEAFVLVDTDED